ncbi:MAG: hypothetical protein A2Y10_16395 [Planctomycetes bacterium GWF2_41_51]|nr:MAG: hypothetical protein A2Y10_16395 [Planctomycetes bacterium GWF2_41_51]HBG27900.1 hypothetical protein [Phycisphaerales bacterium]
MKKIMVFWSVLLTFVFSILISGGASGDVALTGHIANPSFEQPPLFPDDQVCNAQGWVNTYGYSGTQCPRVTFPVSYFMASAGSQCLKQTGTIIIQELKSLTIQANTVYTLNADVLVSSQETDPGMAWGLFSLIATQSNTTLASWGGLYPQVLSNFLGTVTVNTWYPIFCQFDSAAFPELVGQTLTILARGDRHYVDNITLTSSGTPVTLTVNATSGATGAVKIPGIGSFTVGNGWTLPLVSGRKLVNCPDLYSFTNWSGSINSNEASSAIVINGNMTVNANFTKTSPGCSPVWDGKAMTVYNGNFEDPSTGSIVNNWPRGLNATTIFVRVPPAANESLNHAASGNQFVYLIGTGVGGDAQLFQAPGSTVEADTIYTIEVDVAIRSDLNPEMAKLEIQLRAKDALGANLDGYMLASSVLGAPNGLINPTNDKWYRKTLSWNSTGSPYVGKYLQIYFGGNRVAIDNVVFKKSIQGIPATITMATSPATIEGPGARPAVFPSIGDHQVSIGATIAANTGAAFTACPNSYLVGGWQTSYGNYATSTANLSIDGNGTATANYILNNQCGDKCYPYPMYDINHDCVIDFVDFAEFASNWLLDARP